MACTKAMLPVRLGELEKDLWRNKMRFFTDCMLQVREILWYFVNWVGIIITPQGWQH